jgi:superfamily II DNA/RNA helicase
MDKLLEKLPSNRQNLLFSATIAKKVVDLSAKFLKDPVYIKIENDNKSLERIRQRVIEVDPTKRRILLQNFIQDEKWDYTIVFVASKRAAKNLANKLQKNSVKADTIHGDLKQEERTQVLARFKKKEFTVLIATDIAARGIDIENLSHVVNYDLPRSPADYVHRIGRTGRAGRKGDAISFINHETMDHFILIEKRAEINLKREQIEGFELSEKVELPTKDKAPVKGKRKSKKDKLREAEKKLKS